MKRRLATDTQRYIFCFFYPLYLGNATYDLRVDGIPEQKVGEKEGIQDGKSLKEENIRMAKEIY